MSTRLTLIAAACLMSCATARADSVTVSLAGLSPELEKNVRIFLSLTALAQRDDLSEPAIRRLHRQAPAQIAKALQPFGYYTPDIQRQLRRGEDGVWQAGYTIDPGNAVRLRKIEITLNGAGRNNEALTEALKNNALTSGEALRHDRYEALKSALRRAALDDGYLDASFPIHTLAIDPQTASADVMLVLDTGERYSFGQITIEQDALSDSLARRYIAIEAGQPFEQSRLLDAQYALQDSGVYAAVEVTAERENAVGLQVPIVITAISRKRQRYSAGFGYSSDAGPRLSFGWENRRINSRGHRANVDLQLSAQGTQFSTRYSIPIGDPRTERFAWSFDQVNEDIGDDTTSQRQEIGATQTKVRGEWQRNLYLQLTREITDVANTRSTDVLLLPGITFSRSRSDTPVQPRRGSRVTADLRGSTRALASDTDFLRLRLETSLVRSLGRGRLLLRGQLGTSMVSEFSRLPASQRFFAGGDRSVRGFALNELGPRDAAGLSIGGRHFLTASTELEWPVAGRWSVAAFLDAGNAFDSFADPLEYSVGLGGRLRTPVGLIRLDLAKPVSEGDQGVRVHLTLGGDL